MKCKKCDDEKSTTAGLPKGGHGKQRPGKSLKMGLWFGSNLGVHGWWGDCWRNFGWRWWSNSHIGRTFCEYARNSGQFANQFYRAASFNFSTGEFGHLGKKGNSFLENLGYGLGGLANASDILAGFKPGSVEWQTENIPSEDGKDLTGHSQLNHNGDVLVDFGPTGDWAKFEPGRNDWINYSSNGEYKLISEMPGNKYSPIRVQGVNVDRLYKISARMNSRPGFYQVLTRSCSSTVSRALTMSGVPAIGIHPYILHAQMYLRSIGARPTLFSHYLYNR